jgi:hypothetical protein
MSTAGENTISSILVASFPLISAEIFSNVLFGFVLTFILDETFGVPFDYASTSVLVTGIIVGFLVIFIGFAAGAYTFTSHRVLLLAASVFSIIGFVLLRVLDDKFRNFNFLPLTPDSEAAPWSYTIPGFFFIQFAISLLRLSGRSALISRFPAGAQVRAQAFAATFTLSVTAVFRLTFGLWTRNLDHPPRMPLGLSIPFVVIGIILAVAAAFLEAPPSPSAVDWGRFASIDSYPGFFGTVVPLFISTVIYAALDYEVPLTIVAFEPRRFEWHDSFGLGITAVALSAIVGIGGAWIVWSLGGPRGLFVTFVLSVFALSIDLFQSRPPSRAMCISDAVFNGFSLGGALTAVWAAVGIAVSRETVAKYVGLLVGFGGGIQGFGFRLIGGNTTLYGAFLFIIGAILAVSLPGAETKAEGYDGIHPA